jgi:hypothetical protein
VTTEEIIKAAIMEDRERWAKKCEELATVWKKNHKLEWTKYDQGRCQGYLVVAAKLRESTILDKGAPS